YSTTAHPTTSLYSLSLHDALPILISRELPYILQVDRQHKHRRVQTHPEYQAEHDAHRELPALQNAQIHDRMVGAQLVPDERDQRECTRDREQAHRSRREPVEPLTALEHGLQRADADGQQP